MSHMHVIEKQIVELTSTTERYSKELLRTVQPLFEHVIAYQLSQLFDNYDSGDIIYIDKLELDLGSVTKHNFDAEIRARINEQFEAFLSSKVHHASGHQRLKSSDKDLDSWSIKEDQAHYIEVWTYFMDNGYFPASFTESYDFLQEHILQILRLKLSHAHRSILGLNKASQISRFVNHANEELLYFAFIYSLKDQAHYSYDSWRYKKQQIYDCLDMSLNAISSNESDKIFRELMQQLWTQPHIIHKLFLDTADYQTYLPISISQILDDSKKQAEREDKHPHASTGDVNEAREIYVKNAGIVILAPYLGHLYQKLALVNQQKFNSKSDQEKAVKLIHFLATGNKEITEDEITLFKLLCSMPIHEPVNITLELPQHFYEEAELLLKSVKEHWKVMETSSNEALRETFFVRSGKLVDDGDYWVLFVENKGADILLEKIPWTFRTIRLPWMQKNLFVEWY